MKSYQLSYQMGDDLSVQQIAENTRPLNIIQAVLYTCLGRFSIQEALEAQFGLMIFLKESMEIEEKFK